jgi:hypothetical protein
MSIKVLDERHKTLAEELLKGTPRSKIAEMVGVDRTTLYTWMKDPLWQEYFEKLAGDLDEARGMRLLVTVMKIAEVTEAYLDIILKMMEEGGAEALPNVPGLDTISTALQRIANLERQDSRPTRPGATKDTPASERGKAAEQRGTQMKGVLDRILARTEETQH